MKGIVFLDRDGVINRFPGVGQYVTRWEDFHFLPRVKEAIAALTRGGFEIYVISNQGCVSRGLLTMDGLQAITRRMIQEIEKEQGNISGVFYCVHQTSDRCECKKPKTLLFMQAARGRDVDFSTAYFIGDSEEDVQAGRNIGCRTVLVLSGRTDRAHAGKFCVKPQIVKKNLWEAASWILEKRS